MSWNSLPLRYRKPGLASLPGGPAGHSVRRPWLGSSVSRPSSPGFCALACVLSGPGRPARRREHPRFLCWASPLDSRHHLQSHFLSDAFETQSSANASGSGSLDQTVQ